MGVTVLLGIRPSPSTCPPCTVRHQSGMLLLAMQAIGTLSSAYTSGWLIARVGARPALGLMAFFPLLMCFTSGLIREQRQDYAALTKSGDSPSADVPSSG